MKFIRFVFAVTTIAILAQCSGGNKKVALKTDMDSLSYCLGYLNVKSLKERVRIDSLNISAFAMAMEDYYSKKKSVMEPMQMDQFIQQYVMKMQGKEQSKSKLESKNFLEKNKSEKGIVITPSGLQYIVLQEGNGPSPHPYDTAVIAYRGSLIDGTVFDSTGVSHPAKLVCQGLIPGFVEALQMMKAGSKWKIFISPELGYGSQQPPPGSVIKANSVLIFEVEMLSIKAGKENSVVVPKRNPMIVPRKK